MNERMNLLFQPTQIRTLVVRNCFVRSATVDNGGDAGYVSQKQRKLFADLASGGVGLIITGMTAVHQSDYIRPSQNHLSDDRYISAYKELTRLVHEKGAKIAIQLAHMGRERGKFLQTSADRAIGVSFIPDDPYCETAHYREMTEDEIWGLVEAFGNAARRARDAGFDAVQIHGAHAFLVAQFLSPYTNRRTDKWGGTLENRLRFHLETYRAIRKNAGDDFPVLIKLGVEDGFPGGLVFSDGLKAAAILAQAGFDALEISQGLRGTPFEQTEFRTDINSIEREAYFRYWAAEVKKHVAVPVMMVGGIRSPELMSEIIENREADFISLCRPFIREPDLINKWRNTGIYRSRCTSCNNCIAELKKGEFIYCPQNKDN